MGVAVHPSGMSLRSTRVVPAGTGNVPPLTGANPSTVSPVSVTAVTPPRSSLAGSCVGMNV